MPVTDQAFVTLATSDVYFQGALVLGHSLRHHRTSRQLVILTTPQVSSFMRVVLRCVFDEVIEVKEIDSRDAAHLALMKRPELGITFTKLHCWALIKYTKCVFLDADTLVLCNVDELFDREEISAAPDPGWPDCFNTGVFVFRPSLQTYNRLFQFAVEHGSFDGGDQGLLNSFFNDWAVKDIDKHLPFIYNLSSSIAYTYLPAFRHFGHEAKIVHFLGPVKPWHYKYNPQTRSVFQEFGSPSGHHHIHFLNLWWEVYNTQILPLMMQHNNTWGSRALQQHKHQVGHVEVTIKPASTDLDKSSTQQLESSKREMPAVETFVHKKEPRSSDSSPPEPEIFLQPPSRPAKYLKKKCDDDHELNGHYSLLLNSGHDSIKNQGARHNSQLPAPRQTQENADKYRGIPSFDDRVPESEIQIPSPQPSPGVEPLDLAASVSELSLGTEPEPYDPEGRQKWEEGHMDYMGKDSFENIKKKLDRFLE